MDYENVQNICSCIIIFQFLWKFVPWLYAYIIGPCTRAEVDFKYYGRWAIVSGASDGIGKEYAKALAKRGVNIILIARNVHKLKSVAQEIEILFNVETDVIAVDFTAGYEIYDTIKEKIKGKDIGVLVNNVGMSYTAPENFHLLPDQANFIREIIMCNVASVAMMSSIVMPSMKTKKRGLIINISSMSALVPAPQLSLYAATKAFVDNFSTNLSIEFMGRNDPDIYVQSLTPGFVRTKMVNYQNVWNASPMPEEYVESAISTLLFEDATTGYWFHSLSKTFLRTFRFISPSLSRSFSNREMKKLRQDSIEQGYYVSQVSETEI